MIYKGKFWPALTGVGDRDDVSTPYVGGWDLGPHPLIGIWKIRTMSISINPYGIEVDEFIPLLFGNNVSLDLITQMEVSQFSCIFAPFKGTPDFSPAKRCVWNQPVFSQLLFFSWNNANPTHVKPLGQGQVNGASLRFNDYLHEPRSKNNDWILAMKYWLVKARGSLFHGWNEIIPT